MTISPAMVPMLMRQRQQHDDDTRQYQGLTEADHRRIAQSHGEESACETPDGDADTEQASPHGGRGLIDALAEHHIAAGPQHGGGFKRAIAEEHDEDLACATNREHATDTERLTPVSCHPSVARLRFRGVLSAAVAVSCLPQWQAENQYRGKRYLQDGDVPVSPRPALTRAQCTTP